ncbi:MAG: hypothetical protein ACRELB_21150 [Polyangiaceae bacterium]
MNEITKTRESTPLRRVRSTVIISGLSELRARGHYERYLAGLEPAMREAIVAAIAGTWLPVEVATAHFGGVDALGLGADESFDIGAASARRFQQTLWGTLIRVAIAGGADPWLILGAYDRLWARVFDGGGFRVQQIGPKDATIEIRAVPLCRFAYFRDALRGVNTSGLGILARSLYVRELPHRTNATGMCLRASWA